MKDVIDYDQHFDISSSSILLQVSMGLKGSLSLYALYVWITPISKAMFLKLNLLIESFSTKKKICLITRSPNIFSSSSLFILESLKLPACQGKSIRASRLSFHQTRPQKAIMAMTELGLCSRLPVDCRLKKL